jgi:hypothetical protein
MHRDSSRVETVEPYLIGDRAECDRAESRARFPLPKTGPPGGEPLKRSRASMPQAQTLLSIISVPFHLLHATAGEQNGSCFTCINFNKHDITPVGHDARPTAIFLAILC